MTDREKLLVALLSEPDDVPDGGITTLEVVALLYELGEDHRRMWREITEHVTV